MPVRSEMMFLAASAAFVGLVHSLAPGHWLPVVLLAKSRRWRPRAAIAGAVVAASGHILVSSLLGLLSIVLSLQFLTQFEETIERYAALLLSVFGALYAANAWRSHSRCHGHTHHGPEPEGRRGPFLFLFSLGLSPCIAVLPVFIAASAQGSFATLITMVAFSVGVLAALVGATLLVSLGVMKLDHPIFEHYGDVITGLAVALMGVVLFLSPHSH